MASVAVERLRTRQGCFCAAFGSYAEDVGAVCENSSPGEKTFLPPRVIGTLVLRGSTSGTVATNPWHDTLVFGRLELGSESLVERGDDAGKVSAVSGLSLTLISLTIVPGAGDQLSMVYLSGDGSSDQLKLAGTPGFGKGAFERSDPANPNNPGTWRRCYGELLTVQSYNSSTKTITLEEPLTRLYEVDTSTDRTLRVFNVTSVSPKDVTIDGIAVEAQPYGYAAQGWSNVTGVTCAQCMNLTVRNISVSGFVGNGIKLVRCRNATIENCTVEMAPFHREGANLYGVNLQQSHFVTLQDHLTVFGRYAVTINQGCSNILVQRLTCLAIHDSGKVADIHGGDCLDITFQDFDLVNRGIAIGNLAFRRGAKNVTIKNITGGSNTFISCEGSARDVSITNCQVGGYTTLCTVPDSGNGFNNSTGADHGYTSNLDVSDCTFDYASTDSGAPVVFSWNGSVSGIRLVNYQFSGCTFRKYVTASNVICQDRPCVASTTNDVTFSKCRFEWMISTTNPLVALYYNDSSPNIGPVDYLFDECSFVVPSSSWVKVYDTERGSEANFNGCDYSNSSGTYTLDKSLFLDHSLFGVTPSTGSSPTSIYADSEEVFSN